MERPKLRKYLLWDTPRRFLLLCCVFPILTVHAQNDSLKIDMDRLKWDDIRTDLQGNRYDIVVSGSRSEKKIENLPFTIYVITEEDIRENNYLTLVDALKNLPGIRVSQPGAAIEGETFLMRGLLGNSYAKILVNDVPINPFVTKGFPIGAQLPITQAERIEVIYGPAATIYGADASAGVINIILKEHKRPVHAQAEAGMGENGFTRIDATVGGLLGKGKHRATYSVFGSFTGLDDQKVRYDRDFLFNTRLYADRIDLDNSLPGAVNFLEQPNYRGDDTRPILADYPHRSALMGLDFSMPGLRFNALHLQRKDHAALGLNPLAVSHARPFNAFGETINTISLQLDRRFGKWKIGLRPRYLRYRANEDNNTAYVLPNLGLFMQQFVLEQTDDPNEIADRRGEIVANYFNGNRFNDARSDEFGAEAFFNYDLNQHVALASGVSFTYGEGMPLSDFRPDPAEHASESVPYRVEVADTRFTEYSAFLESYLNFDRLNVILGGQVLRRQNDFFVTERPIFNPRVGLQYKVSPKTSIRTYYGEAFRYPTPFFNAGTYNVDLNDVDRLSTGAPDLTPEKTFSWEAGLRTAPSKNLKLDASLFYTRTKSFVNYGIIIDNEEDFSQFRLGYFNDDQSFSELLGLQMNLTIDDILKPIRLHAELNFNYNHAKQRITSLSGDLRPTLTDLDFIPPLPLVISQLRLKFEPLGNLHIILDNTFVSKTSTSNIFAYVDPEFDLGLVTDYDAAYTLDASATYRINDRLDAFVRVKNLFNTRYAGIDARPDLDALFYNPQSLRFVRAGLRYNLNGR